MDCERDQINKYKPDSPALPQSSFISEAMTFENRF